MKKSIIFAASVFSVFAMASCGGSKVTQYTVSYYDGNELLSSVSVEEGTCFETYIPEKDGYTFMGWYATPSFSKTYDLTQGITGDVSLFACFSQYVEDTRTFYIVGSGTSPILSASNWGKVFDDTTRMTKSDKSGVNEYTITLDLAKGDQFQFAINEDWANQRGAGYLADTYYNGVEYMKILGSVYSDKTKKSNIECEEDGNYTFTLTTYPSGDYYDTEDASYTEADKEKFNYSNMDTISYVRNGDATTLEKITYDYYIKGNLVTGWENKKEDAYKMTYDKGIYKLTIELAKDDEFMFYSVNPKTGNDGSSYFKADILDTSKSTNVEALENGNFTAKENGTYTFVYYEATGKMKVNYTDTYTK